MGEKQSAAPRPPLKIQLTFLLGKLFPGWPRITAARTMRAARRQTGLDDWGEVPFEEGLRRLVASFRREAGAHVFARRAFRDMCARQAAVRLEIQDWLRREPGIAETPVTAPVFVVGLPRTGTTLLHNLLSLDAAARPLLYWEQETPAPPPDPERHNGDPRIKASERGLGQLMRLAPELPAVHNMAARAPEECNGLLENCFASHRFFLIHNTPSYMDWLRDADLRGVYGFHKRQLQMLSWKFPARRWTLKAPSHLFYLDDLLAVYPDANIVIAHREPAQALPSICSLALMFRRLSNPASDPLLAGRQLPALLAHGWQKAMAVRRRVDSARFLDISYRRLTAEPVQTIRDIYDHFGLAYSDAMETAVNRWLADNRQHKHGVHRYSLDQFGLTDDGVRGLFAEYRREYGDLL